MKRETDVGELMVAAFVILWVILGAVLLLAATLAAWAPAWTTPSEVHYEQVPASD